MSGVFAAILSVICYSFSYVFLHKGQVQSDIQDNGLLAVLVVGTVTLGIGGMVVVFTHGLNVSLVAAQKNQLIGYGFAALSGIIGTLFGRLSVYAAIRRLGATRGIVVGSSESLVTLVLAAFILREKLHITDVMGLCLLCCGISLLILERLVVQDRSTVKQGVIFGLVGAILQGTGHFVRKLGTTTAIVPIVAAAIDLVAALLLYVILLSLSGRLRKYLRQYVAVLNAYIVAAGFCSAAGVLLFFVSVKTVPVWEVAMILGMEPIAVTIISKLLFRDLERTSFMTGIYTIVVTVGIVLLQVR